MNTFIKSLLLKREKLSVLEEEVLDYILERPEIIEQKTLEELSNIMFVSTATISRTFKKLGFSGFQEFKFALISHNNEITLESNSSQKHSLANHLDHFERELNLNINHLRNQDISKVVELLKKSKRVEFFGVGASLPLSIEGARKLTFAGLISSGRSDWDELRIVAQNMDEDDVAILISMSGETLHIIEYANILMSNNVPIITITGNDNNHLIQLATIPLVVEIQSCYYGNIDMSSRTSMNMLLDMIVLEYLESK